ncbi:unnamed protein product [marine sediment metagenome]|uniref:Uncharacterized protein n=1 Tax=marine sediment metagenome TaxID=412755 RepID=X1QA45_9ZZZZ
MQQTEERGIRTGLVVGGVGGATLASVIAILLAARPARAAPTDEKLDYLIEVLTTLVPLLAEVSEGQAELITVMQQWLAAQGIEPGVEIAIRTDWVAKEPEQIYRHAIRAAGTFYTDRMANWTKGKRIMFKAESSLNQAVNLQVIGNIVDDHGRATDIDGALPLAANGNLSVGLAWDDWHPYVGVRITVPTAEPGEPPPPPPPPPTAGILTISAVVQE